MTKITRYVPIENSAAADAASRWTIVAVLIDESESKVQAMFAARKRHLERGLPMTAVWSPYDFSPTPEFMDDARAEMDHRHHRGRRGSVVTHDMRNHGRGW